MLSHATIEEEQIAERYVMGKLPPDEATRFEEHYLSCPECLDRLELAESMERGFKRAAGQDASRVAATRQLALVAWLARLGRSRQLAALLMTVIVVALLPGLVGFWELRERGRELADVRSALVVEKERSAAGSRTAEEAKRQLEASQRDLAQERKARATADEQLKAALQPQINVPILLNFGAERGNGERTFRVFLPRSPGWIVLDLVVEPPHPPTYRAVLRDARGKVLWSRGGLRATEDHVVDLMFHSTLLPPGVYTLTVEGVGAAAPVTFRYTFRTQLAD